MELYRKLLFGPGEGAFESAGVCNPTCIKAGGVTHMFYRAIGEDRRSAIGYCRLDDKDRLLYRSPTPILSPEFEYEANGLEDPKILKIGKDFILLYHAFGKDGVVTAYATSTGLQGFTKRGILKPLIDYGDLLAKLQDNRVLRYYAHLRKCFASRPDLLRLWGKDFVLFPGKIRGRFVALHRIPPLVFATGFDAFEQLTPAFWEKAYGSLMNDLVLAPEHWFETRSVSVSVVPMDVGAGWLTFFHCVEGRAGGVVYRASAALLDRDDPRKVLGRLSQPLFEPEHEWEKSGICNNTVYVSGAVRWGRRVHLYYGAADSRVAVVAFDLPQLLQRLRTEVS